MDFPIVRNMVNHAPDSATQDKMEDLRGFYHRTATELNGLPESRERSLAFTLLEQSLMYGIAALARDNYDNRL